MKIIQQEQTIPIENLDFTPTSSIGKHGKLLPNSFRAIICGPSGCGKTNALLALLFSPNGAKFKNVYVYSKSLFQPKYELLQEVIAQVNGVGYFPFKDNEEIISPDNARPNSIFIFDDVSSDGQQKIREYYSMCRHKDIDAIWKRKDILESNWSKLDETTRDKDQITLANQEIEAEGIVKILKCELDTLNRIYQRRKPLIKLERQAKLGEIEEDHFDDSPGPFTEDRVDQWVDQTKQSTAQEANEVLNEVMEPGAGCSYNVGNRSLESSKKLINKESSVAGDFGYRNKPVDIVTQPPIAISNENVSMKDLIDALKTFGSHQGQQNVILKGQIDKELPKFSGEPERWIEFIEEYKRTTAKYQYDDSENLLRLRKSLVGPARTTVQHLMTNVKNVPVIVDSLEKRFGRPRVVLNALAARAKACSSVTTVKPETIIEFGLAIQALATNIESFGELGYFQSVELLDNLVQKLSHDLATRWFEWVSDGKPEDLRSFSIWITQQLNIAYQRVDVQTQEKYEERKERSQRRAYYSINATSSDSIKIDMKCPCCGRSNHFMAKCFVFKKKSLKERWKIVKETRSCFSCLNLGHCMKDCSSSVVCKVQGCNRSHHYLLHETKLPENEDPQTKNNTDFIPAEEVEVREGNFSFCQGAVAFVKGCDGPLPIVPVKVKGPGGTIKCHALLDTGASRSLINKDLAARLGITGEKITYSYKGITGDPITDETARIVNCDVSGVIRGSKYHSLRGVVTIDQIKMNPYSIYMDQIKQKWNHLQHVAAPSLNEVVPELIVGNNNPRLILAGKLITRGEDEPIGWRSNLGWAVSGNLGNNNVGSFSVVSGGEDCNYKELHDLIKQTFSFDNFGVKLPKNIGRNLDEKRSYNILECTTTKVNGVWKTGLWWRNDDVVFPPSIKAALKRLESTERKMKDPEYATFYRNKIQEYLDKGYCRKLCEEDKAVITPKTYYIPHFGHMNPNKPGKFRLILDAKATVNGVSLNSKLLKGPDLIRFLVEILWNFRRRKHYKR